MSAAVAQPRRVSGISRLDAEKITPAEFMQHVQNNQPLILQNALKRWKPLTSESSPSRDTSSSCDVGWTVQQLQHSIGSQTVNNVFEATAEHRHRFKYFKSSPNLESKSPVISTPPAATATAAPSSENQQQASSKAGLQRHSMSFGEFVKRSEGSDDNSSAYYLYGEPMPPALQSIFSRLPILSSVSDPLTSSLLWVSLSSTISPLHYDLSEGILCQLFGSKKLILASPSASSSLYPHPVQHAHDRQSQIDDIHDPDRQKFPLCASVDLQIDTLQAGEFVYIPYGWWHQIEAPGASISVSLRWNPYVAKLQSLAAAWHGMARLPLNAREQICAAQIAELPPVVYQMNRMRWTQLAQESSNSEAPPTMAKLIEVAKD